MASASFIKNLTRHLLPKKIVGWKATALDESPGLGRVAFDVRKPNTDIYVGIRLATPLPLFSGEANHRKL
ncbi:hypothetical protein [Nostoc sp. CENA543]|uniref:hypothetical protein n=1 Tax=Nostoc sp. CENA543 TaxID=1869241 RepID=UPI0013000493|nr:hypothetical protein [Nostoc sp. CENA543]